MADVLISALLGPDEWTASAGIVVEQQLFPEYCASGHATSVAIRIPSGSAGKSAQTTMSFNAAGYDWITLSMASLRQPTPSLKRAADAHYAIELANGQVFYVPVSQSLSRVSIPVDGFSEIVRLKVIILHGGSDYLILSDLRATRRGLPQDLLLGVKLGIEAQRDRILSSGREIGTVTGKAGDTSVVIDTNWSWLERNVVLQFGEGIGAERHQVLNVRDNKASMMTTFDGPSLTMNREAARAFVTFPVEIGYYDREAELPGIAIWYSSPVPSERSSRVTRSIACFGPLGAYVRREGALSSWHVSLEIVARSPELAADAAVAARAFLASSLIWAHGERLWFDWKDPSMDSEPVEGYDIVPRASYTFDVEVREDSWQLERLESGSPILTVAPYVQ